MRVKVTATRRDGKIALWVEAPDKPRINIWDLEEKELTKEVLEAIRSAVLVGAKVQRERLENIMQETMQAEVVTL